MRISLRRWPGYRDKFAVITAKQPRRSGAPAREFDDAAAKGEEESLMDRSPPHRIVEEKHLRLGQPLAIGTYLYRLVIADEMWIRKIVLIR